MANNDNNLGNVGGGGGGGGVGVGDGDVQFDWRTRHMEPNGLSVMASMQSRDHYPARLSYCPEPGCIATGKNATDITKHRRKMHRRIGAYYCCEYCEYWSYDSGARDAHRLNCLRASKYDAQQRLKAMGKDNLRRQQ